MLVLRRLLREKISLRLQYGLWALVLLRLLLPISFGATVVSVLNLVDQAPIQTDSPAPGHWEGEDLALSLAEPGLGSAASGGQAQYGQNQSQEQAEGAAGLGTSRSVPLKRVLLGVWAAGAAALGAWLLWVNLRFAGQLRRSRRPLAADCPLPVYLSGAARAPCLFGLLHPAIYLTEEAKEGMWEYIRAHDSMIDEVRGSSYFSDPIAFELEDGDIRETIRPYIMGRIVDVEQFFPKYHCDPTADDVCVSFAVTDVFLPWNNKTYTVRFHKGTCTIQSDDTECCHTAHMSVATLTTLLLGYKSASKLYRMGRITANGETIQLLDDVLLHEIPYISDYI